MGISNELERFNNDIAANKETAAKFEEALKKIVEEKSADSDSDAIVKAAGELGYRFTAADMERSYAERQELDLGEMEQVAGGKNNPNDTDKGSCWVDYYCLVSFNTTVPDDADGHSDWCSGVAWHCYTAFLHTNPSQKDKDDTQMACWSNYGCMMVNK